MLSKRIFPFLVTFMCFGLVGCGSESSSSTTESTTQSPVSNSINGAFDGYQYNINGYENVTEDINNQNGYRIENPDNSRFSDGMKGAEKISGNKENIIKDTADNIKENYQDIEDKVKKEYEGIKQDSKEAYQKIKDSVRS